MSAMLILAVVILPFVKAAGVIIGGHSGFSADSPIGPPIATSNTVETFGCNGNANKLLPSYPLHTYEAEGLYLEAEDKVLICGGYECGLESSGCAKTDQCHSFSPQLGVWTPEPSLTSPQSDHIMLLAKNLMKPSSEDLVPLMISIDDTSEIWDMDAKSWMEYMSVPGFASWSGTGCYGVNDDLLFGLSDRPEMLDTSFWNATLLGSVVPYEVQRPGRCVYHEQERHPGLFTRHGRWIDMITLEWKKFAPIPLDPLDDLPKTHLWSFKGLPTFFGLPECDVNAECSPRKIVQYQIEADAWIALGYLQEPRFSPAFVEVPDSWCN